MSMAADKASGDASAFADILFPSQPDRVLALSEELKSARQALVDRFPVIETFEESYPGECSSISQQDAFATVDKIALLHSNASLLFPGEEAEFSKTSATVTRLYSGCSRWGLLRCLSLCGIGMFFLPPGVDLLFGAICGVECYCAHCSSETDNPELNEFRRSIC